MRLQLCIESCFDGVFQRSRKVTNRFRKNKRITVARSVFCFLKFYFIIHAFYLIDGLIRNETTMRLQMFNGCERAHDDDDDVRTHARTHTLQQIER